MREFKLFVVSVCIPLIGFTQVFNVGERTLDFVDESRGRPIKAEVWYPTLDLDTLHLKKTELPFQLAPTIRDAKFINEPRPLLVLSHGTGGNRFSLAWLAIELAKNGYIVISPDHWGNTYNNKIPEYFVRYWDRPLDISFLMDSIHMDESLFASIDQTRIGMIGFSLGGHTALALAGVGLDCELIKEKANTRLGKNEFNVPEMGDLTKWIDTFDCNVIPSVFKDERFKTFVAMAPALGLGLAEEVLNISKPVFIIAVDKDKIAPVENNALKYHKLIPTSKFYRLQGKAGHYIFLNEGKKTLQKEAKRYYRDDASVNRQLIHEQLTIKILTFLQATLY